MVVDAVQDFIEGLGNTVQILERQFTIVQLPVGKDFIDQMLNQSLDACRCGILQRSRGGLHHIGQHDQPGFDGLGPGTGVPEIVCLYGFCTF